MSEIRAGDLVMVVRPGRCGCTVRVGVVFQATGISFGDFGRCSSCGWIGATDSERVTGYGEIQFEKYRLRRLDPDALKTEDREELHA